MASQIVQAGSRDRRTNDSPAPYTKPLGSFSKFCQLTRKPRHERLLQLSGLARENWDYINSQTNEAMPILSRYIDYTFRRIKEQNRIAYSVDGKLACFNTGLMTDIYRPIYGLFVPARTGDAPWYLLRFTTDQDDKLDHFAELPKRATYFQEPGDLIYDPENRLSITDHSLVDRAHRFPSKYHGTSDEMKAKRWHALKQAAEHAEIRVAQSYKTAVPQYYWPNPGDPGVLQLLLPICLGLDANTDFALAVQRVNQVYRAYTILELDWAYGNARLIAKPDSEWLKPVTPANPDPEELVFGG